MVSETEITAIKEKAARGGQLTEDEMQLLLDHAKAETVTLIEQSEQQLTCAHCMAPIPFGTLTCEYCGSEAFAAE